MNYTILVEHEPGQFLPTDAVFFGSYDEVVAHLVVLQGADGRCYAAELIDA